MIRLAVVFAASLASCSHPAMKPDVTPGQVVVVGDVTFQTREGGAIDVSVTRALGEQHATGMATLHGMTLEGAQASALAGVAKGRAWLAIAALEADPAKAYEAAMHGINELGTAYRGAKGSHHVIDDTEQNVRMAKLAADKGDNAGAATELTKVLHQRIEIYLRTFPGSVE